MSGDAANHKSKTGALTAKPEPLRLEASPNSGVSVNVTDYGAVGNSLIDDSQAFAKAWRGSYLATQADQAKIVMPAAKTFLLQPIDFKLHTC